MLLAQSPPPSTGPDASTIFYLTLLVVFFTAIITTVLTKWARDKCLKFFDHYHVTIERARGQTHWGICRVYSSGIEILLARTATPTAGNNGPIWTGMTLNLTASASSQPSPVTFPSSPRFAISSMPRDS